MLVFGRRDKTPEKFVRSFYRDGLKGGSEVEVTLHVQGLDVGRWAVRSLYRDGLKGGTGNAAREMPVAGKAKRRTKLHDSA